MNSRERLLTVLKKQIPDRVPISAYELVGWNKDSWENNQASYKELMDYIRLNTDCLYMTGVAMENNYVKNNTHVTKWMDKNSLYIKTVLVTPKGDLQKIDRIDDGLNTSWHIEHFVKDDNDIDRFLSIPDELMPVDTSNLKIQEQILGDKGILLVDIADPICIAAELFHFEDYTVTAWAYRNVFRKLLDKIFESQMFFLKDALKKGAGPLFRVVGPEYATQPYLSEELFHEYVCKYDTKMISMIHDYGKLARVHCHGRIRNVLPHIIEMEADAIDPVEAPPSGDIELEKVKKLYGDRLCIMGNIQLKDLEYSTPEQIKQITLDCLRSAKNGGGYVIMPTASPINVPLSDTALRNYKIFIDTALEYGKY